MAWTAEITNSYMLNGDIKVSVTYRNKGQEVVHTYKHSAPGEDWIHNVVRRRLRQLESNSRLNIPSGPFEPGEETQPPTPDPQEQLRREYERAMSRMKELEYLIGQGVLRSDDNEVVDLKQWLDDNIDAYLGREIRG